MFFYTTLACVAIMLLYAVPGYLVVKTKLVSEKAIAGFATVLMYVCMPCLTMGSLLKIEYSGETAVNILIFFCIAFAIMFVFATIFYNVFKRKYEEVKYRIYTIATFLGNCTFMGIPLLEALFPDRPIAVAYSISFFLAMNILCWTFGSFIITGDSRFISVKKLILNPAVLSVMVTVPLWIAGVTLPSMLFDAVSLLGKMTTPMCMLVLGMRLATMSFKSVFGVPFQYVIVCLKQVGMPLIAFAVLKAVPVDPVLGQTLFIICCTPVASVVLNFAEMLGKGQETAANCVLLSTLLSILTIPTLSLLLQFM